MNSSLPLLKLPLEPNLAFSFNVAVYSTFTFLGFVGETVFKSLNTTSNVQPSLVFVFKVYLSFATTVPPIFTTTLLGLNCKVSSILSWNA